uniref:Putative recombinase n=1 Tax=Primula red phytoplasma TaxID=1532528 RepID=A0A096XTL7_9MOLU|nr:putative recombinase [Primula red phytoplasma]
MNIIIPLNEQSELGGQPKNITINLLHPSYKVPFGDLGVFLYQKCYK